MITHSEALAAQKYIWYDGRFVSPSEAYIPILTHGLHYGSAVFEGIRAYNGRIFAAAEHYARLHNSARLLELELDYTIEELIKITDDLLVKQALDDAYIRPIIWRGSERITISAPESKSHIAIAAWEFKGRNYHNNLEALRLITSDWRRPPPACAPFTAKAAGLYVTASLCKQQAEAKGYNDALMLDWRGFIAESASSNIFLVLDGKLHTPLPDCFLNGITRQKVIWLAKEHNIEVIERYIKPEELASAQEVFLTGTASGISRVKQIDEFIFDHYDLTATMEKWYGEMVINNVQVG